MREKRCEERPVSPFSKIQRCNSKILEHPFLSRCQKSCLCYRSWDKFSFAAVVLAVRFAVFQFRFLLGCFVCFPSPHTEYDESSRIDGNCEQKTAVSPVFEVDYFRVQCIRFLIYHVHSLARPYGSYWSKRGSGFSN